MLEMGFYTNKSLVFKLKKVEIFLKKRWKSLEIVLWERKYMEKIREIFYKHWTREKSDKFYETLKSSVLSYKIDCLEKFIEDIFKDNPSVKRDEILRYTRNMDSFSDAEEFLIEFFSIDKTAEGESVLAKLEEDPKEISRILDRLLISKQIKFKETKNEFIVWYCNL